MIDTTQLHQLDAPQLREMVRSLMGTVVTKDCEIAFRRLSVRRSRLDDDELLRSSR
ncbi:hypothetical protein [Variovorax paradoxus]|uniref:hypothetical protein n=1 Tax=Variovorax paradoxus TaxID=34073 RepID=UPI0029C655A9|nr:hypothetical protein [Variovorax paradoxus]WPH20810.1 hypothetical protein RZE78_01300 [Variovorax paradoxus]